MANPRSRDIASRRLHGERRAGRGCGYTSFDRFSAMTVAARWCRTVHVATKQVNAGLRGVRSPWSVA